MTKRNPDSLSLKTIEAFLMFVEHGNAERAGEKVGSVIPTTLQRNISRLEAWLHRLLITHDNPARLTIAGIDFIEVAKMIRTMAINGGLWNERTKTRISRSGLLSVDGCVISTKPARIIGETLLKSRAAIISSDRKVGADAGEIYVYLSPRDSAYEARQAKAKFKTMRVVALKLSGNIKLMERSSLDEDGLKILKAERERLKFLNEAINLYREMFGPFDLISGAEIKLD